MAGRSKPEVVEQDEVAPFEPGPPHCSSVIGHALYSLGLDPQADGEAVLGVSAASMARILSGERPTPLGMMRDIEHLIDGMERTLAEGVASAPFVAEARHHLRDRRRMMMLGEADSAFLVHDRAERRWQVMSGWDEALADLHDGVDWPRDSWSMWGACCRIVGWSPADSASALGSTLTQARSLIDGRLLPGRDDWKALFRRYDELLSDDGSPVGVGIRWARAAWVSVFDEDRETLELHYSAAGDGAALFEDGQQD